MSDLVSVIVPVYNAERYIDKCIESIIEQTYKNIEVILIDDGSTDNSKKNIEKYMIEDERLKYFYQDNSGPSVARNRGISEANGKFIIFIDSDDWIDPNMFKEMLDEMNNKKCDLVLCDFVLETEEKSIYNKIMQEHDINVVGLKKRLINGETINSQCHRVYRKDIIVNNNLKFNEKLKVGEDQIFNMEYINHINNVSYIEKGFYHYRMVSGSTCRKVHENQLMMLEYQQSIRNNIINMWKDDVCEYRYESAKWFLQNIASYCYLASITLQQERKQVLDCFIKSRVTKESLRIISNKKNIYDVNMHKIIIPLIKLENKFLIVFISNIYYRLNYIKRKLLKI